MINKLKKSKAGFTLVELIVVIAIIGVLAAVLVPQYIQYVEKSRETTDANAINELFHAVEIATATQESLTTGTVALTVTSGKLHYAVTTTNIGTALADIYTNDNYTMKSTNGKAWSGTISVTASGIKWVKDTDVTIGDASLTGAVAAA